jgi:hypothetical protein
MQLIRNVGEVTPWDDRLAQVPPETVAVAVGALLEVSGSREWAYRIAYTLFDAKLIPRQTQIGNAGMTLTEWDEWSNEVAALMPAEVDTEVAQEELIRRWVEAVALAHEHTANLTPEGLSARDALRDELLREWVADGYELPADFRSAMTREDVAVLRVRVTDAIETYRTSSIELSNHKGADAGRTDGLFDILMHLKDYLGTSTTLRHYDDDPRLQAVAQTLLWEHGRRQQRFQALPEPDRWESDGDGCVQPQWDMPTDTVTAWAGGISTAIFGYREDLDDVERQAYAMLAAVGYAREFAAKAAERTEQK